MGLSGAKFCDFVVWTPQSFEVITVNFEISIWETDMWYKNLIVLEAYCIDLYNYDEIYPIRYPHVYILIILHLSYKGREKIS